jgi:hypothetical protein
MAVIKYVLYRVILLDNIKIPDSQIKTDGY